MVVTTLKLRGMHGRAGLGGKGAKGGTQSERLAKSENARSDTGTRTRATRVKAAHPYQLDHAGVSTCRDVAVGSFSLLLPFLLLLLRFLPHHHSGRPRANPPRRERWKLCVVRFPERKRFASKDADRRVARVDRVKDDENAGE